MKRLINALERSGYLRAAAELQRMGYRTQAIELRKQAQNLGNH